jgi:hypothetical protein
MDPGDHLCFPSGENAAPCRAVGRDSIDDGLYTQPAVRAAGRTRRLRWFSGTSPDGSLTCIEQVGKAIYIACSEI